MLSLTPNRVGCEAMAATRRLTAIRAGIARLVGPRAHPEDAAGRLRAFARGAAKSGVETLTPWAAVQGSADILLRRYGAASRVAGRSR